MSTKEEIDLRGKPEAEDAGEDVVAHAHLTDDVGGVDPERERKRKRKMTDDAGEDDFGRKRK